MVTVKFECTSNDKGHVVLCPVYCGSRENETAFKLTPQGKIDMQSLSETIASSFVPGQEYLITIKKAD